MQERTKSEQAAKAGIYIVFSLSLFAFLMFFHSARTFSAAGAVEVSGAVLGLEESVPLPLAKEESPVTETEEKDVAKFDLKPLTLEERLQMVEDSPFKSYSLEPVDVPLPDVAAGLIPHVYGKEIDMSGLQSEINRMAAMGFSFSNDLTANYMGEFFATSYCCEAYPHICGGNGVTASGTVPTPGLTVAADWTMLPPGTWIYISGVGIRRVEDSGSAIKAARLDVAIDTHANALRWGGQGNHDVWILE